jgi:hypothetical protein
MKRLVSTTLLLAPALLGQANVVPGLDGKLEILDNITYWGRRGAANPGGEVGLSMRNTMCNPGSVSIPWYAQMQQNHPKFGFIITHLSGDRMVQISDRSYCKHAFTSASTNGACGTCNGIGGSLMGVGCSDTYSASHNAGRGNLGPATEINPWLGTWNHLGSFFDQGFPNVGPPGNADGVQSPITPTDEVMNRVTVKEADLLVGGSSYYYGIQLIHQGEALANRWDNIKSRGFVPTWNGTTWSVANSAVGQAFGSILQHWTGAEVNMTTNGTDDGRVFVANKVTALGGGQYHYEYAVHNVDMSRGGATFRVPIDATATGSNFTFRDIDQNPLNNWTAVRVGNEIVWSAPAGNALEWNSIFNFGFDANFAPGASGVTIDAALPGTGALYVTCAAKAPSGATFAQATAMGSGCGGSPPCFTSFYESGYDGYSGFTITPNAGGYAVSALGGSWIAPAGTQTTLADDQGLNHALQFAFPHAGGTTNNLWVCSNGFVTAGTTGSTSYTPTASGLLAMVNTTWALQWRDLNPAASGSGKVWIDSTAARAVVSWNGVYIYGTTTPVTFQAQFWPSGQVHVIYQSVANATQPLVGYTRGAGALDPGASDLSAVLPAGFNICATNNSGVPALALASSARPVVGTTINLNTSNILPGSLLGLQIMSTSLMAPPLDLGFLGMPGCNLYQALDVMYSFATPSSTASFAWPVPNVPAAAGLVIRTQSAVLTPGVNAFGFATANAVDLLIGIN